MKFDKDNCICGLPFGTFFIIVLVFVAIAAIMVVCCCCSKSKKGSGCPFSQGGYYEGFKGRSLTGSTSRGSSHSLSSFYEHWNKLILELSKWRIEGKKMFDKHHIKPSDKITQVFDNIQYAIDKGSTYMYEDSESPDAVKDNITYLIDTIDDNIYQYDQTKPDDSGKYTYEVDDKMYTYKDDQDSVQTQYDETTHMYTTTDSTNDNTLMYDEEDDSQYAQYSSLPYLSHIPKPSGGRTQYSDWLKPSEEIAQYDNTQYDKPDMDTTETPQYDKPDTDTTETPQYDEPDTDTTETPQYNTGLVGDTTYSSTYIDTDHNAVDDSGFGEIGDNRDEDIGIDEEATNDDMYPYDGTQYGSQYGSQYESFRPDVSNVVEDHLMNVLKIIHDKYC